MRYNLEKDHIVITKCISDINILNKIGIIKVSKNEIIYHSPQRGELTANVFVGSMLK